MFMNEVSWRGIIEKEYFWDMMLKDILSTYLKSEMYEISSNVLFREKSKFDMGMHFTDEYQNSNEMSHVESGHGNKRPEENNDEKCDFDDSEHYKSTEEMRKNRMNLKT